MSPRFRHRGPRRFRVVVETRLAAPFPLGTYRTRASAEQAISDIRRAGYFQGYVLSVEERNELEPAERRLS